MLKQHRRSLLLPFAEVVVYFNDGTKRRKGVETTTFWRVLMPPASRDMTVNRASDNPASPSWFFRLSAKFLEMYGSSYGISLDCMLYNEFSTYTLSQTAKSELG